MHAEGICQEIQRWIEAGREDAMIVEGKEGVCIDRRHQRRVHCYACKNERKIGDQGKPRA